MRILILLTTMFVLLQKIKAQTGDIIEITTALLKNQQQDSVRAKLLLEASEYYLDLDNDSALYFNNRAVELIEKIKAESLLHRCYHHFVKIYHAQFNNSKALEFCLKAIAVAKKNNELFQQAASYRAVFNVYHNLKQDDSAVKYGVYALNLTEKIGDTSNIATNYGNLCRLFNDLEQFDKAIEYGKKGIAAGEKYSDKKGLLISMNNLGNCYLQLEMNKEAIAIFEKQLVLGKKYKRMRSVQNAFINLGVIYFSLADKTNLSQIAANFKALEKDVDENDNNTKAWIYIIEGYNLILLKNYKLAETALLTAEQIYKTKNVSNTDGLENIYLALAKLKFAQEDFLAGNFYDSKWDSINRASQVLKLSEFSVELEQKYQSEAKAAQIELQQVQLKQKTNLNYFLAAAALLILLLSLLGYRNYTSKRKLQKQRISELETEKKLTATEAVLKGEEQERTRLAKDLHDGLGGILSGVKYSLTTMKANTVMTPDNAQAFERSMDMLDSSIQEMRRVAHNMMPEALVKFGLDTALKDFCNDITQSGALEVSYQSIGLADAVEDHTMAITVYRIVQELINNSIKHAAAKTAIVQVSKTNNLLSVTVEDDGKGFDTTVLNRAKGIGWSNIQSRIDFLKGKIDVQSADNKGTSVHIEITI